jgi:hypothetical protein
VLEAIDTCLVNLIADRILEGIDFDRYDFGAE